MKHTVRDGSPHGVEPIQQSAVVVICVPKAEDSQNNQRGHVNSHLIFPLPSGRADPGAIHAHPERGAQGAALSRKARPDVRNECHSSPTATCHAAEFRNAQVLCPASKPVPYPCCFAAYRRLQARESRPSHGALAIAANQVMLSVGVEPGLKMRPATLGGVLRPTWAQRALAGSPVSLQFR
jgi:hypothetical protein